MSALRRWLAEGTSQRWLAGASVVLAILMVLGLVGVVVDTAGTFFWPRPLVELTLSDGSRALGEIWDRESDPRGGGGSRLRLKVGNRDVLGADFRWISEGEVRTSRTPAGAWLLERREYGNFYGFPRRLEIDGSSVASDSPSFAAGLNDVLARAGRLATEERHLAREADRLHVDTAKAQLLLAAAERRGGDTKTLEARLAAAQESESQAVAPVMLRLAQARSQRARSVLVMAMADGRERSIPVGEIVRSIPVNTLDRADRIKLYLSRWWEFISAQPRESNTEGGIFPAIFGTALMVLLMTVAVVPLGVVTAVYLNEYAKEGAFTSAVRLALANLAGVPSIVFGAFGLAFFVYTVGGGIDRLFFSDILPTPTFGTGGILWASLTLALLTLPVVVVATEEGLQAVPHAVRDGARALGATRWQTLHRVVLPYAAPGILTGAILAVARGAGEVAPLMLTGVVKLAPRLPLDSTPPFLHLERKFMHLGFHIYDVGFQSPNVEAAKPMVYATVLVLLVLVVVLNLTAVTLRSRLRRRLRGSAV